MNVLNQVCLEIINSAEFTVIFEKVIFFMSRAARFKSMRRHRRNYVSSFFLSVIILILGVGVVDYSVNSLMYNKKEINIISLDRLNDQYQINFLGYKLSIDTSYIRQDYKNIVDAIKNLLRAE